MKHLAEEKFSRGNILRQENFVVDTLWRNSFVVDTFCGTIILWWTHFVEQLFCGGHILWKNYFVVDTFCGTIILCWKHFAETDFVARRATKVRYRVSHET